MGGRASKAKGIWRRCIRFPDYEISERGAVRRAVPSRTRKAGHRLTASPDRGGYLRYHLSKDGRKFLVYAHVLVLEAFVGPKPSPKHEGAHNDGKPWHNHYKNLRWDTRRGNHADLQYHGTAVKGSRNGRAKLTEGQVVQLRKEYAMLGKGRWGVAAGLQVKYGISRSTLRDIVSRAHWGHV